VGQLAVAAVGLAPLVEQGQDLALLFRQQPVHRRTGAGVIQRPGPRAGHPALGAALGKLEDLAGRPVRPALRDGLGEQVEQAGFRVGVDPPRDGAAQPQCPFPSTKVSLTAISFRASDSRAISARAASSS
jgi:hypothetical protein